jgi:ribosomal protein L3 glutamine methyltransferase
VAIVGFKRSTKEINPCVQITALEAINIASQTMHEHAVCALHGYVDIDDEAAVLVAFSLAVAPRQIETHLNQRLTEQQLSTFNHALNQRCILRQPMAYVTGDIWFYGQRFLCDARALVPRSLIAQLLPDGLLPWIDSVDSVKQILDLCTGGASLAILASQAFARAHVVGSDISRAALNLAEQNKQLFDLPQLELIESDLFNAPFFAQSPKPQFDLIICNPPYVNSESMANLPAEFLAEPQGALGSGKDGMDLIRKILPQASEFLTPRGLLLLEIGHEMDHFLAAFAQLECIFLPVNVSGQDDNDEMIVLIEKQALDHLNKTPV